MSSPLIEQTARQAAKAARGLALASTGLKNEVLGHLAAALEEKMDQILAANAIDIEAARLLDLSPHMVDRLSLDELRVRNLIQAVDEVITLPDPVGEVSDEKVLPDGLKVSRLRIPLGLIAFICEARPGALVEAGALTIKSGNGLMVKCGREMSTTAGALADAFNQALTKAGLAPAAVTVLPTVDREDLRQLLSLSEVIDLVIPRGGEGLIRFVDENSRIPVLKHFKGVCHLYVDQKADLQKALALLINGKTQRPSTCNSLEALLVHQSRAAEFLPLAEKELLEKGVTIKADSSARSFLSHFEEAEESDWGREFLDLTLAVKVVPSYEAALEHIAQFGSCHTEVIATENSERAQHFLRAVEASCVIANASSRLNDGGCLGLGAEIGISTTRLHAYGPMGLRELTTTRFVVEGSGQLRN